MLNFLSQAVPLKIALLTHSVNPRGGVIHTLELANALHEAGHDVTVFAPAMSGQRLFRSVPFRLHLIPVAPQVSDIAEMVKSRISAFELHFSQLLLREQFDLFHAQDPIGANALANLKDSGRIDGFIRTVHHLDTFSDPRLMQWQFRGMHSASLVLCVSKHWVEILKREHSIEALTVHNGVDLNRFNSKKTLQDYRLKERLGLRGGKDAPLILAVGGVEERKNTLKLLQAFAKLRNTYPKAQLVVAGGSTILDHSFYGYEFQKQLEELSLPAGLGLDVIITGALPEIDMPALFRSADVLAMPSVREGFGLVVLESLASGTPVVVSKIAPFTEYLGEADCGWVEPQSVKSICEALTASINANAKSLNQDPPHVCHQFSWSNSGKRHVDIYRRFLTDIHATPTKPYTSNGETHAGYAL